MTTQFVTEYLDKKIEEKYARQSIDRLFFIREEQLNLLKNDNVKKLGQLVNTTSKQLQNYGFDGDEINQINIELQLLGARLKWKN